MTQRTFTKTMSILNPRFPSKTKPIQHSSNTPTCPSTKISKASKATCSPLLTSATLSVSTICCKYSVSYKKWPTLKYKPKSNSNRWSKSLEKYTLWMWGTSSQSSSTTLISRVECMCMELSRKRRSRWRLKIKWKRAKITLRTPGLTISLMTLSCFAPLKTSFSKALKSTSAMVVYQINYWCWGMVLPLSKISTTTCSWE